MENALKIFSFIFLVAISLNAFTQQNNFNEDYTPYLAEARNMTRFVSKMPSPSLLTKEGLEKSRQTMNSYINPNTIIKPIVRNIDGPVGIIPIYIYKPDTVKAVVLDIHGGGFCEGVALNDGQFNDALARTCKVAVISIDYHLAPENPFPACIDDCKAIAKWLVTNEKSIFGTEYILLSGASAGAHLAALTTIYIRDSLKAINRVKGVNLIYGVYDLGRTPSQRLATDTNFLSKRNMDEIFQLVFKGWTIQQLQNPQYSPLYNDLHNLPSALFTVGGLDPLVDDTYFMEARWREAGNKTFLAVYPESPHAFDQFPTQIAKVSKANIYSWINEILK